MRHRGQKRAAGGARLAVMGVGTVFLAGCLGIAVRSPNDQHLFMSREEFAQYAERVFRYHNQVMNELIETTGQRREGSQLSTAEAKMIESCQPLNEAVSESLSGKSADFKTELKLADTVSACEEASRIVDNLIR